MDFAIVGTGAGGGTLAARLAEKGFSVVAFDAGPFFRPLEDFASDEEAQSKLYWLDERIVDGADPLAMGGNNSGKCVGGSTVHFAMVSLRFRPEHFKARTLLGYGADWPVDWREMWAYYDQVERALSISGPLVLPLGAAAARLSIPAAPDERAAPRPWPWAARHMGMKWAAHAAGHRLRADRGSRRPACSAASAASAAPPTPSRARWWCGSPAP